jgi:hypothetical protein
VARRLWGAIATALAVFLFAGSFLTLRAHHRLSTRAEGLLGALSAEIGVPIESDGLRVTWWRPGVVVDGVQIPDLSSLGPGRLASARQIRLQVGILPLLGGEVVVDRIEVEGAVFRFVRGVDGSWNFADSPAVRPAVSRGEPSPSVQAAVPHAGESGKALSAHFDVGVIDFVRARVSIRDRAIPGVPEFEITEANARLERTRAETLLDVEGRVLGGGDDNFESRLRVPRGAGDIKWEARAQSVLARRLPEMLQLVRGGMPFPVGLEGAVSAELAGDFPKAWPPEGGGVVVAIDATEALVSVAGGALRKPVGLPFELRLDLLARDEGFDVRQARLSNGDAWIELVTASTPGDAEGASARRLEVRSQDMTAEQLAAWAPRLALFAPRGSLEIDGFVESRPDGPTANFRLEGTGLGVEILDQVGRLDLARVDLRFASDGTFDVDLELGDLQSPDVYAHRFSMNLRDGGTERMSVRLDGERGGRPGASLDRFVLEGELGAESARVENFEVAGLGGAMRAEGEWFEREEGAVEVRVSPQWDGLDLASLFRLFGREIEIQGLFTGEAVLAARRSAEEALLDTLEGQLALRLEEGGGAALNLARLTFDNLDSIPGLRQAVERRALQTVPGLVEETTRIDSLRLEADVAGGALDVRDIRLDAPDYVVDARGRIGFGGEVELRGELVVDEGASRALTSGARLLGLLAPDGGAIRIPVSIVGTYPDLVSAPSPAFLRDGLEGVVEREAGGAARLLRRFLGEPRDPSAASAPGPRP